MIAGPERVRQIGRPALVAFFLLFLADASAFAQGKLQVGVSVGTVKPSASELSTKVSVGPTISGQPSRGWGLAFGLSWFNADVDGSFVGMDGRLARLDVRPLMFGVGYTAVRRRLSVSPSIVAGPSLNTLEISDEWTEAFGFGSSFERRSNVVAIAVRPGVNVTYSLHRRLVATAFGGYLFNRPKFTLQTPTGETETRWTTDGVALSAGIVIPIF